MNFDIFSVSNPNPSAVSNITSEGSGPKPPLSLPRVKKNADHILFDSETDEKGAIKLTPKSTLISVHDYFDWTFSGKDARRVTPKIVLTEYQMTLNTTIGSFFYLLRAGGDNITTAGDIINDVVNNSGIAGGEGPLKGILQTARGAVSGAKDAASKVQALAGISENPYSGLYFGTPTGFAYEMPYFQYEMSHSSDWGAGRGAFQEIIGAKGMEWNKKLTDFNVIGNVVKNVTKYLAERKGSIFGEDGIYQGSSEEVYSYTPSHRRTWRVSFPLFNVNSFDAVKKNWDLCFLLQYQNIMRRKTINLIEPPVFYSLEIPGHAFAPVVFLKDYSVSSAGKVTNVSLYGRARPIPEAYVLSLEFQEPFLFSKNFAQYQLDGGKVEAVTVIPENPGYLENPSISSPPATAPVGASPVGGGFAPISRGGEQTGNFVTDPFF